MKFITVLILLSIFNCCFSIKTNQQQKHADVFSSSSSNVEFITFSSYKDPDCTQSGHGVSFSFERNAELIPIFYPFADQYNVCAGIAVTDRESEFLIKYFLGGCNDLSQFSTNETYQITTNTGSDSDSSDSGSVDTICNYSEYMQSYYVVQIKQYQEIIKYHPTVKLDSYTDSTCTTLSNPSSFNFMDNSTWIDVDSRDGQVSTNIYFCDLYYQPYVSICYGEDNCNINQLQGCDTQGNFGYSCV